jgi:DNA polymerase-3 subunit epsilon
MGPNSLDALCRRYGVDNSRRAKHGALLDSELLADVYLELIGGRQTVLGLVRAVEGDRPRQQEISKPVPARPLPLPPRLSGSELDAHKEMIHRMGEKALWRRHLRA